jgi:hypothetical protein
MSIKIFLAGFVIVFSCKNQEVKNQSAARSAENSIVGLWGGPNENSPVWEIKTDSIYYFEQKKSYKYKISEDSLLIYFPDHIGVLYHIYPTGDTLIFYNEVGYKIRAIRFKKIHN